VSGVATRRYEQKKGGQFFLGLTMLDVERRTVARAIASFLARNPIEERGDVKFGFEVRRLLVTSTNLGIFERTRVEVIAYLIREPKQANSFLKVFIEDYLWRGDVLVGLLAGLEAAEGVDMRGIRRFLPARGLRWFSPTNLRRLIVDDPDSRPSLEVARNRHHHQRRRSSRRQWCQKCFLMIEKKQKRQRF
jgi:hypothetical protein